MYTLIIADDEQDIREGLSQLIDWESVGFRCVATAANGHEALELIRSLHPDAALCDIRMPGMTGLDLAQQLHDQHSPTLLVLLSAYRDFEYARTAMACSVRHYLVKSARNAEILDTFRRIRTELDERRHAAPAEDLLVMDVCSWIAHHLDTAALDSAARHFGRSPSGLSRYFHQKTGETFSQYLLKKRMERASELLLDGRMRVADISARTGYTTPQNFSRTFRQFYGMTPREFRERRRIIPKEEENE